MKKFITLLTLTLASGIASANGFHPWADQTITENSGAPTTQEIPFNGFAPWRDRLNTIKDVRDNIDIAQSYEIGFRPWS